MQKNAVFAAVLAQGSKGRESEIGEFRGTPPRVFWGKSLEVDEKKGDGVLWNAKEFGIV